MAQSAADRVSATIYELLSFDSPEALAHDAAELWCAQLDTSTTVALSGGRIATQLFKSMAQLARSASAIHNQHFFWADERCVSPDDPESNYRTARELLFEPLAIPLSHIHRIRGEDDPGSAAKSASDELACIAGKNPQNVPILDLVILGMGEDGHVASLFPGASPQPGIYYPVIGPKPPPRRITVSYDVIIAARDVWVLVSGSGKQGALAGSLGPGGGDTPLARVVQGRKNTRIFCDFRPE